MYIKAQQTPLILETHSQIIEEYQIKKGLELNGNSGLKVEGCTFASFSRSENSRNA